MIELKIRMFGAFRKYERVQAPMVLQFQESMTVAQAKTLLATRLHENFADFGQEGDQLIDSSVIANETQVLSPDTLLTSSCTLSILPPVCGG